MNYKYDILLKNGYIVDPVNNKEGIMDLAVKDGKIIEISEGLKAIDAGDVYDITGKYVMPGVVDIHTHLTQWLGGPAGYKMLSLAGVTTALDMAGPVEQLLEGARDFGTGINVATVNRLTPGYNIPNDHPTHKDIEKALDHALSNGSIGLKIMGGNYPLTREATVDVIQTVNDRKQYVAFHAATIGTGSQIEGFHEAIDLAGDNCLHLAHINSYCRGMIRPYMQETQEAVDALKAHPKIRSEAYLAIVNGNNGKCVDGVPEASVIRNCLKTGGFEASEDGFEKAIMAGWAQIHMSYGGTTVLRSGKEALEYWKAMKTDTGVSFPVNPPEPRYVLAVAKRDDGKFVVDTISTDGGGIPRNYIISCGLSLVKFGALSFAEFVTKASVNPGRILGLVNHGHLGVGAAADITVLDYERQGAYMSLVNGQVNMYAGHVFGKGLRLLTTPAGIKKAEEYGLTPVLTDIGASAFYKGL